MKNDSIGCDVNSCRFNDQGAACCTLTRIEVKARHGGTGSPAVNESICGSYRKS